ncbi:MAG: hypothetical protein AMJ95_09685 [Omnitrophica WOR_2 bacterium SM23_72]|nr:MAG: hypothetical protein AMJ95_09685 [Omnitrophica WOR_2 bacterium SM23_72]
MKRKGFQIMAVVCVSLLVYGLSFAASTSSLTTSVTVDPPSGVSPVALRVAGTGTSPADWADLTNYYPNLDFGPLTLYTGTTDGTSWAVFLPSYFYSVDMAYTYGGGAGITQFSFSYSSDVVPLGQPTDSGLGVKSTATFVRKRMVDGVEVTETPADRIAKVLLRDVGTVNVLLSDLSQGWLRMYVGVVTKDPALPAGDVELTTTAQVFSPGDVPGDYSGILTVFTL